MVSLDAAGSQGVRLPGWLGWLGIEAAVMLGASQGGWLDDRSDV